MFIVSGLQQGKSSLSGKTGEVLHVKCQHQTFEGWLLPKEFLQQVRLRSANGQTPPKQSDH